MFEKQYRTLAEGIRAPEDLQDRVLSAARKRGGCSRGTLLRWGVCAACAMALVLGTVGRGPAMTEEPGRPSLTCELGLAVCAAETEHTVPDANGGLAFVYDPAAATADYSGCLFRVTGAGLERLTLSIDRGGLYRQRAGEEPVPLGDRVTEDYDPSVRYGFRIPPGEDIDCFDGARLGVTAVFAGGGEDTGTYVLSTGVLYPAQGDSGSLVPLLSGDDRPGFYGVYAAREESRWFTWPVENSREVRLSAPYGHRERGDGTAIFHSGMDLPAAAGTPVLAALAGTVLEVGFDARLGNYLLLDHGGGLTTLYGQCLSVSAAAGDRMEAGGVVAQVGATGMATGPHLHFEVRQGDQPQNPVVYFAPDLRAQLYMK